MKTEKELLDLVLKRCGYEKTVLVDQFWKKGIQLKISGPRNEGDDRFSFLTMHRDTEDECVSDVLGWLFSRRKDDHVLPSALYSNSKEELELKLEA